MAKITLFVLIIQVLPKDLIKSLIKEHGTDKHSKGFNTWSKLVSMIYCKFAYCVSLREISNGLHSANGNPSHLGMLHAPTKSSITYQNEKTPMCILSQRQLQVAELFRTAIIEFMKTK